MLKIKSAIAIDIITVYRYNNIKAGEYYEHQRYYAAKAFI